MFIGEAPGRDEDEQGKPFVGRAGQLLTDIIKAMKMTRDDVYIANRLVDLYVGPLNTPYKAFRELRRIIERYPNTSAAQHARVALAALKERHAEPLE